MINNIWALDFEASGLTGRSYPIEVGYTNGIIKINHIIRPTQKWLDEYDWDPDAEKIHGLTKKMITNDTTNVWDVKDICEEMNMFLVGKSVYVDGGIYDMYWKDVLFDAAGIKPEFVMKNFRWSGMGENTAHRALQDAEDLWKHIYAEWLYNGNVEEHL